MWAFMCTQIIIACSCASKYTKKEVRVCRHMVISCVCSCVCASASVCASFVCPLWAPGAPVGCVPALTDRPLVPCAFLLMTASYRRLYSIKGPVRLDNTIVLLYFSYTLGRKPAAQLSFIFLLYLFWGLIHLFCFFTAQFPSSLRWSSLLSYCAHTGS